MVAPELQARLTAASALVADFRAEQARTPTSRPIDSWALRLALAVESLTNGLRGALSMLGDADAVLADQESSGLMVTGGLSISIADAPTVMDALSDAAWYQAQHGTAAASDRYRELAARIGGPQ